MTSKQHEQIAAKLMEMASALAPNISNGPDFTKAFDRFFGVEGAYDMFVSDLYDALKATAA